MSAQEVGVGYVSVVPSLRNFGREMRRQLQAQLPAVAVDLAPAGARAGASFGAAVGASAATSAGTAGRGAATAFSTQMAAQLSTALSPVRGQITAALTSATTLGTRAAVGSGLTNLVAGFRDARAAQSAFTGGLGTLGGRLASLSVDIRRGLTPVVSGLGSLGSEAGQAFASGFRSVAMVGMKTALIGLGAAVVGLGALGVTAVKTSSNIQQAGIAFEQLLGSAEAGQAKLRELLKFAAQTPFDSEGVVTASQRLLAYGFTAEELIPTLTTLGDAAAGLSLDSDGINRLAIALGQISSKGRVQAQELQQIAETGVKAKEILSQALGVTQADLEGLVEKGLVPADFAIQTLLDGIKNGGKGIPAFGGAMEKQGKSLAGVWENLKDSAKLALNDGLQPFLDDISASIKALIPSVTAFANAFGNALGPALASLATDVGPAFARIGADLGPALGQLITALGPLVGVAAPVLGQLATTLGSVLTSVAEGLLPVFQSLAPTLVTLFQDLEPYLQTIVAALAPALLEVAVGFGEIVTMMLPLIPPMVQLVEALMPALPPLIAVIVGAFKILYRVWGAVAGSIVAGIQACAQAMGWLVQAVLNSTGAILDAAAKAFSWIPGVGDNLRTAADQFRTWAATARTATDEVTTGLAGVRNALYGLASGVTIPISLAITTTYSSGGANTLAKEGSDAALKAGRENAKAAAKAERDAKAAARRQKEILERTLRDINAGGGGSSGGAGRSGGGSSTASTAARAINTARTELLRSVAGDFVRDLVKANPSQIKSQLKDLAGDVRKALTGAAETRTLGAIKRTSTRLRALARERSGVVDELDAARKKLTNVLNARRDTIRATRTDATGNITTLARTPGGIVQALRQRLGRIRAFAKNLRTLAKRGLPKSLLGQIIDAGLDEGATTAATLASASATDFRQIVSLSGKVQTASSTLGKQSGSLLYDSGVQAARGLVEGLKSQESAIARQMRDLANALVTSVKKALGIKSPSRVFADIGRNTGLGLIDGLDGTRTDVSRATARLLDATTVKPGGFTLNQRPSASSAAMSPPNVRVFIGDRELTDMVRVEVDNELGAIATAMPYVMAGGGSG
jgi:tape measure domain-containing protein